MWLRVRPRVIRRPPTPFPSPRRGRGNARSAPHPSWPPLTCYPLPTPRGGGSAARAMERTELPADASVVQVGRFRRFLAWLIPVTLGVGVLDGAGFAYGIRTSPWITVVALGYAVLLLGALVS